MEQNVSRLVCVLLCYVRYVHNIRHTVTFPIWGVYHEGSNFLQVHGFSN